MKHVRDYYGVPARRGGRIRFNGRQLGTITSALHYIRVRLDETGERVLLHPTWRVEYLSQENSK